MTMFYCDRCTESGETLFEVAVQNEEPIDLCADCFQKVKDAIHLAMTDPTTHALVIAAREREKVASQSST